MGRWGDQLIRRLNAARVWPLPGERPILEQIDRYIALRESDRDYLKAMANWDDPDRQYKVDPLAPLISSAFGALLFGRALRVTAAAEADQPLVDALMVENASGYSTQHRTVSSEGEVWYRLRGSDAEVADVPVTEWYSRTAVVPLFVAARPVACAFVERLDPLVGDPRGTVYRHFEVHDDGDVVNLLYRGEDERLGDSVDLGQHPDTEQLAAEWNHGLAMLAGRVVNREGIDVRVGLSDYHDIEDFLLELNEVLATGAENRHLTAKKRIIAPTSALDRWGRLPEGEEVLVSDTDAGELGEDGKPAKFGILEFNFDAAALIAWQERTAATALGRIGITPQFVGAPTADSGDGSLTSGTALRIRLIPSVNAGMERADGSRESWARQLPRQWSLLQQLDALPVDNGGFGRSWSSSLAAPAIDRGSSLPEDPVERDARLAAAVTGRVCSIEQAVRERNAERGWTEQQIQDEVTRIREDEQAANAAHLGAALGGLSGIGA